MAVNKRCADFHLAVFALWSLTRAVMFEQRPPRPANTALNYRNVFAART